MVTENKDNCMFCKIVRGEISSQKVYDDKNFIGILDINPIVMGHTLIISKKHFRNLLDMPISLGSEFLEAIKRVSLKLIEDKKADGINVLSNNENVAGQLVLHTHIHIIPRKKGDGLKSIV